jgi:hypothetical protein
MLNYSDLLVGPYEVKSAYTLVFFFALLLLYNLHRFRVLSKGVAGG